MHIKNYQIIEIKQKGANANVYLGQNSNNEKIIIKHFTKAVQPYVGYGKHNHFGRRREGASDVFQEIKEQSLKFPFLIKFYERFKWENKWCITLEYFDGITFSKFLKEYENDEVKLNYYITKLAHEISFWHKNDFAHGDAHLENILVNVENEEIKLIDYGQLHHPSFKYCKKFKCFEPRNKRIAHDLENPTKNFGKGFITELSNFKEKINTKFDISGVFKIEYEKNFN